MTKPLPDVRVGDVWRSRAGHPAKVEAIRDSRRAQGFGDPVTMVHARLKTGADKICELANFVKGRTLVERSGVRVGDIRAAGEASTIKVLRVYEDGGLCETATAAEWLLLAHVATMPLIERDGKPVEQPQ